MALKDILVPDIGNFDSVDVIEVLVKAGDTIAKDDSIITVESDKASMDIPAPYAGVVKEVKVKVGDKVAQGSLMITLEASEGGDAKAENKTAQTEPVVEAPKAAPAIPEPSRPAPEPPKPVSYTHLPVRVAKSNITSGNFPFVSSRLASVSVSANTMRPSASVCTISILMPFNAVTTSFCL